jgi:hypothetical protein
MDAGLLGLEFEAHGKGAPVVKKSEGKAVEKPEKSSKFGLFIPH